MGRTKKGQSGYVFSRKGYTNGVHPRTEQRTNTQKYTTDIVTTEKLNQRIACLCVYGCTRPITEFAVTVQICSSAKRVNHCIFGEKIVGVHSLASDPAAETEAWG